ncbi:MATE family efflux transporter [Clostridiaceae bacterium]|nr:MATE family efflux transporter [Clostridiaceae bacterium]
MKLIKQNLWSLILPITFQQFMLALVSASDAFMLGRLSQDALSAVSLAGQIAFLFNLVMAALTIGTNMFAAQYWGTRDRESIRQVMGLALRTAFLTALLFCAGAVFAPRMLMRIFTDDAALIGAGAAYLRAVGLSYLLSGVSQIYLCILKNTGQAGKSMAVSSATVVLNVLFNAVLIFGAPGIPALGITGAALATVLANAAGLIWCVCESLREDGIRPDISRLGIQIRSRELEKRFWRYTAPVLANELVWGGGFAMYTVIMGRLGTDAVAANSIANIAKNLVICFCLGLGGGGSILVGNELGAGHPDRARAYGAALCRLSALGGAATGAFLLAMSPAILHVSSLSARAQGYLGCMLAVSSVYLIGKSINSMTIGGIFCAGGDSKFGLICDAVTLWCVIIPAGMAAAFVYNAPVPVIYALLSMDEIIKLPVVYWHYKKYKWVRNITGSGPHAHRAA